MTNADFDALRGDLRQAEGLRLKAYQDTEGVWTIGFGTNLQQLEIDETTAEIWLTRELLSAESEANRFPWFAGLTPRRQRAIVELLYNLGLPRLLGFTKFLKAMSERDYETAAAELLDSKWARQVKYLRATRIAEMIRHG